MRRYLRRADLTPDQAWRLIDWLMNHGATQFTLASLETAGTTPTECLRIETALAPHLIGDFVRDRIATYGNAGFRGSTTVWALNPATIDVLHQCFPDGPLGAPTYRDQGWVEDLEIYRDDDLVFAAVSHEGEAMVQLGEAEWPLLAAAGLVTHEAGMWI